MIKGGIPELLNFKQKGKNMDEFIKVPVSEKLAYCFGDPALTLMYTMTTTLLIYFYTNVVGISVGAVGMIMLVSRVFDGFSDVLMGTIIDRTHSKYGKARIWILRLALPYAIAAILLFTMPSIGSMGKIIYAFVTYNIMNTVVYTAISQPFHALGSLMSRDRRERDVICNIRMVLSITASMVITAFTLPLINKVAKIIHNEQMAWIIVTAVYAGVSVLVLINTYMTCTERVQAAAKVKENIPFLKAFKTTVTNRYFLIALGLMIFYTAYQIIIGTDLTYYCQYVLGNVDLVMPLSAAEKVATIVGIAMLPKILLKYGKRNLICAGCALGIVGQLIFLLNITSVPLGVLTCIMRGFGIAPFYGVQYSLPGDAIEYGHWKSGLRVEGLMFSSMSMGQKAGSGITSAIMSGILAAAGFNGLKATAAEQTSGAITAIKGFYLYVPIGIWVVMLLIAACYKLDKVYDKMMQELIAREGKEGKETQETLPSMAVSENQINVAIGRVYGSSGRKIAEELAKELNCRLYDRQIICLLAEKMGMENADLESVQKYLDTYNYGTVETTFSPYSYSVSGTVGDMSPVEMFETQSRLIRGLAKKAPGVFLGRCANFVLKETPHTYSFFLYADDDYRAKEAKEYYDGMTLADLNQRDKLRNDYYEHFTGIKRDDPKHYDMVVNVSKTGVEGAVAMILEYIKNKEKGE